MRSTADDAGAEAGHGVVAEVLEGNWWHGDADIGGEQGDQPIHITGLPCANELCDERTLGGRVRSRGWFAIAYRRQAAPQASASPFKGTVDRFDGRVEYVGYLVGVVSEHLAQNQHCALASG